MRLETERAGVAVSIVKCAQPVSDRRRWVSLWSATDGDVGDSLLTPTEAREVAAWLMASADAAVDPDADGWTVD